MKVKNVTQAPTVCYKSNKGPAFHGGQELGKFIFLWDKGVNAKKTVIPIDISYDEYKAIIDLWN